MFRSSALFLTLLSFLHLTLAVPNPSGGVFSHDPAPTVGPFSKVNEIAGRTAPPNTTEFATTDTEIAPLAEYTTTDTIDPQAERCEGTTNLSPFTDDVVVAWNFLVLDSGKNSCTIHENCKLVSEAGTAAITVYADPDESMDFSCREIAMLVKERVKQCHPNFDTRERTGGKIYITLAGKSFVVITPRGQSVC